MALTVSEQPNVAVYRLSAGLTILVLVGCSQHAASGQRCAASETSADTIHVAALPGRSGEIVGVAINVDRGGPIVQAAISIEALGGRTYADANGTFRFSGVPPGRYRVKVERLGYAARRVDGVNVSESAGSSMRLVLWEKVFIDGCH